ncbi:MAG: hypothetical protein WB462_14720 [Solirubrobacterales bacterium]
MGRVVCLGAVLAALSTVSATPADAITNGQADAAKTKSPPVDLSNADHCDFIGQQQGSLCLLPFPDDYYTIPDAGTATGLRINLKTEATQPNVAGQRVDTAPYNLNDGFSPGQTIVVKVPGLNSIAAMQRTGAVPINHIGEYARPDQPIVVIDATTGERWPIWSEIDSNATDPNRVALLIHPAVDFAAKHRYIVALRDLRTAGGQEIPAPNGFLYYRDKLRSGAAVINQRRHHFKSIFKTLRKAHIKRKHLYLAWDFTVSSDQNIAARMLHIRNDAFAQLGDTNLADLAVAGAAPQFSVSSVQNLTAAESPNVARLVLGTFTVPCYLRPDCAPGGTFQLDSNGLPTRNGNWTANFVCIIPRAAIDPGARPSRPSLHGHGLLASALEVTFINQQTLAQLADITFCATDEIGLSSADLPTAISFLQNLSNFPKLGDRMQQGLLDELFLGRLMIHPNGFLSNGAFHVDGTPGSPGVIDPTRLYYNGNSHGGVLGGALTAVAPDFTRASLGVPAMNFSVLLNRRSTEMDPFPLVLDPGYPDKLTQELGLSLIQMLWDRSDPNGYAHRMTTDPLPNTPPHKVLLDVAFGDHQVTTWQADVEARTIGAAAHAPILDPGRWPGVDQLWDIPRIGSYPFGGSAIFYWDIGPIRPDPNNLLNIIGTDPPPLTNTPNRSGQNPHVAPRAALAEQQLVSSFLQPNGVIVNTCGTGPCYAGSWTGP